MTKVLPLQMSRVNPQSMASSQTALDNRIEVCLGSFSGVVDGLGLEKSRPECERHLPGKKQVKEKYVYMNTKTLTTAPIKDSPKCYTFTYVTDVTSLDSITKRVNKNTITLRREENANKSGQRGGTSNAEVHM